MENLQILSETLQLHDNKIDGRLMAKGLPVNQRSSDTNIRNEVRIRSRVILKRLGRCKHP